MAGSPKALRQPIGRRPGHNSISSPDLLGLPEVSCDDRCCCCHKTQDIHDMEIISMKPLLAFNLWQWVESHRQDFEPPVGNKVIWEDSQFTAMIIHGPNARRDFHVDPSDEIFYMLKGDMVLEYMHDGKRQEQ